MKKAAMTLAAALNLGLLAKQIMAFELTIFIL
jgi:hypothetical protein